MRENRLANIGMIRFEKGIRRLGLVNVYPGLVDSTLLSGGATERFKISVQAELRCSQISSISVFDTIAL
jgi:hypothetical protein